MTQICDETAKEYLTFGEEGAEYVLSVMELDKDGCYTCYSGLEEADRTPLQYNYMMANVLGRFYLRERLHDDLMI